ncbi:hypothetical protein O3M35_004328 [Rhynocoris fuscipes]
MGLTKKCTVTFCQISLIIIIITFSPGLEPDLDFEAYTINVRALEGPLVPNTKLNNAEHLFENELKGPEDFAVFNNELYTSCHGGIIYKVETDKLTAVLKTGKHCAGLFQEHICGRPLGIKFDKLGALYIADAYYGLLKANLSTGEVNTLVSMEQNIEGFPPMIPNSLFIDDDVIYWTDSSTTHHLYDGLYTVLGNTRGRLLKYILSEKRNEVLMRNLNFPNGIILSKDKSFLIISETSSARLLRYYLRGPKAGTADIFIDNLPGFPDNILPFDDNLIVSLIHPLDSSIIFLCKHPLLRKFLARSLHIVQSSFKIFNYFIENQLFDKIIHWIGHFESLEILKPFAKSQSISIILNYNGQILGSLQANDSNISSVSSVIKYKNYYYLGSPMNPYIGRVQIT